MKFEIHEIIMLTIITIFIMLSFQCPGQNAVAKLDYPPSIGTYFGQDLPGLIPEIFAPGIVSVNGRFEYGITFSPGLNEIFWTVDRVGYNTCIFYSKIENGKWKVPGEANFTKGLRKAEMEPFVSPNGERIYFTAFDSGDYKIWFVKRLVSSWSIAEMLDSPINNDKVMYPNSSANGDIYYTNVSKLKMYYAPQRNQEYPEILETENEYGLHGFIEPHKDYMLIDAPKENDKTKDRDIYVCFKNGKSTWTKPINLGEEVNTKFNETCPSISPDGQYLFFSRYNEEGGISNIYWVSTELIKKIKANIRED